MSQDDENARLRARIAELEAENEKLRPKPKAEEDWQRQRREFREAYPGYCPMCGLATEARPAVPGGGDPYRSADGKPAATAVCFHRDPAYLAEKSQIRGCRMADLVPVLRRHYLLAIRKAPLEELRALPPATGVMFRKLLREEIKNRPEAAPTVWQLLGEDDDDDAEA